MLEMSLLYPEVSYFDDSFRPQIEPTALGFLRQLQGLTIFDLKGEDSSRTRVVTTLIHGNEPSGFIASHLWLRSSSKPATDVRVIICNPEAARTKPMFTNRYLGRSDDLNRFFLTDESDTREVALRARQIKQAVAEVKPEAIIDLHNTSGNSPAFGVAVNDSLETLELVGLFSSKLILTGLSVGAIMELDFGAPIATIECGGSNEIYSHQVATDGLHEFFTRPDIFQNNSNRVSVHRKPVRVELVGDASIGFSHHRLPTTDITLRADIEILNREPTPAGEFLGWFDPDLPLPLKATDEQGNNQIDSLIEVKNGCLFARNNMQLFMVTTVTEIATNDCIFYATIKT